MNSTEDDDALPDNFFADEVVVAVSPKISAFLSIVGSCILLSEIIAELRKKRFPNRRSAPSRPLLRTLLAMTIADLFFSLPWLLGSWLFPKGDGWQALGNLATCQFEAFVFQVGLMATPLFNVTYSIFTLLMLRFEWTDAHLARAEPWVYGIVSLLSFVTAIVPVPLELFNPGYRVCWFGPYPIDCHDDDCERGGAIADQLAFAFVVFPAWLCIGLAIMAVAMIYLAVRHLETRLLRYASGRRPGTEMVDTSERSTASVRRDRSRAVGIQAIWYISAFLLTYALDFISYVLWTFYDRYSDALDFFAYILFPMQGCFNLFIFLRSRSELSTSLGRWSRRLLFCQCRGETQSTAPQGVESVAGVPLRSRFFSLRRSTIRVEEQSTSACPTIEEQERPINESG